MKNSHKTAQVKFESTIDEETFANVLHSILSANSHVGNYGKYSAEQLKTLQFDHFLTELNVSGASGGSCWGSSASGYTKDKEDLIEEASGSLAYYFSRVNVRADELLQIIRSLVSAEIESYNAVLDRTESEYYGNYSNYSVYAISLQKLFDQMKQAEILIGNSATYDEFYQSHMAASVDIDKLKADQRAGTTKLATLKKQLNQFSAKSEKEKDALFKSIAQLTERLAREKKSLASFDETAAKNRKNLEQQISQLEEELVNLAAKLNN